MKKSGKKFRVYFVRNRQLYVIADEIIQINRSFYKICNGKKIYMWPSWPVLKIEEVYE